MLLIAYAAGLGFIDTLADRNTACRFRLRRSDKHSQIGTGHLDVRYGASFPLPPLELIWP